MILTTELIIQLVAKVGIPAAIAVIENLRKPSVTIDEAITALRAAAAKSADDYLAEAQAKATAGV